MTYKKESWLSIRARLERARQGLTHYRSLPKAEQEPGLLDDIVWQCWSFGEYAVNVCLEMHARPIVQDHSQAEQARQLHTEGLLAQDYCRVLEQLELFRKQASHLSYNRQRSTHYHATNVEVCLDQVEALAVEIESLLRARRKL